MRSTSLNVRDPPVLRLRRSRVNADLAKEATSLLATAFEAAIGRGCCNPIRVLLDYDKTPTPIVPRLFLTQKIPDIAHRVTPTGPWNGRNYLMQLRIKEDADSRMLSSPAMQAWTTASSQALATKERPGTVPVPPCRPEEATPEITAPRLLLCTSANCWRAPELLGCQSSFRLQSRTDHRL